MAKTQFIQLNLRLTDARLVAKRAQSELFAHVNGLSVAGATVSTAKRAFPKVTVVIDSICEEELATEVPGPARFVADKAQGAVQISNRR